MSSSAAHESLDASDYENLSSCTSGGRYATLPPQQSTHHSLAGVGSSGGGCVGAVGRSGASSLHREHGYSTAALTVIGRDDGRDQEQQQQQQHQASQQTLSLHRPNSKRSHWVNHNGRPSDVLARVLQANQDWLDPAITSSVSSSSYEPASATAEGVAAASQSCNSKDNRTSSLRVRLVANYYLIIKIQYTLLELVYKVRRSVW